MVLITDPGPDPDDMKTMLIAGILHRQKEIKMHAIVANGGHQAERRAKLALCLMDLIGVRDVPVGIGSEGKPYVAQAHDLRDLADLIAAEPELFVARACEVAVMGGLTRDDAASKWRPDTSVNNGFDHQAAAAVYDFCFARGVPLTVVSRMAVPMLPMQLAKSFAVRTQCQVMSYLADAQFLGLEGLWQKLCEGTLPPRCTKQWYFETFCGVSADDFRQFGYERLQRDDNIIRMLNGFVKPYDVIALMAVLPLTRECFARHTAAYESGGATHTLLLDETHMIDVKHVVKLLRNTFVEVVLASRDVAISSMRAATQGAECAAPDTSLRGTPLSPPPIESQHSGAQLASQLCDALRRFVCAPRVAPRPLSSSTNSFAGSRVRGSLRDEFHGEASIRRVNDLRAFPFPPPRPDGGALPHDAICALLESALTEARVGQAAYVFVGVALGLLLMIACIGLFVVDRNIRQLAGEPSPSGATEGAIIRTHIASVLFTTGLSVLALAFQPTHRFLRAVRVTSVGLCALYTSFIIAWLVDVGQLGQTKSVSDRMWEGASYNAARLLCVLWMARSLLLDWCRVRALTTMLVQMIGVGTICEALVVLVRSAYVNDFLYGARGPEVAAVTAARSAIKLAIALPLLWPGMQRSVRASFSRALLSPWMRALTGRESALHAGPAPIAPLLGFGSTHEREVHELMSDVAIVFFGAPIDPDSLAQLRATKRRGHVRARRGSIAAAGVGITLTRASSAPPRRRKASDEHGPKAADSAHAPSEANAAAPPSRGAKLSANAERRRRRSTRPRADAPSLLAHGPRDSYARRALVRAVGVRAQGTPAEAQDAQQLQQPHAAPPAGDAALSGAPKQAEVDAYVVHSFYDSMDLKAAALEGWAQRWEARHGRTPTVFMDVLCADPSLRPWEHLQHMPAYLAKSKSLLILAGPTLTDRLWCMMELYTWFCVGGSLQHVHVLPLSTDEATCQKVIAAFDTFAVMYARTSSEDDKQRLVLAVEIALVGRFNDAIRSYLPVVRSAFENGARGSRSHRASAESSDDLESNGASQQTTSALDMSDASRVASRPVSHHTACTFSRHPSKHDAGQTPNEPHESDIP
ncbi:hypothetical protein KFE25_008828 [Diacronema lutheri]|uniref:Uncharacterized protein n=1 Tax=Diacronema lutheri TaxID=2081491 RepID=A0A8J6CCZ4_DIALT|nr:hypothetical protein KFE25_008828 [Diacronema lutheri]